MAIRAQCHTDCDIGKVNCEKAEIHMTLPSVSHITETPKMNNNNNNTQ